MPAPDRQPWFRAKRFGYGAGLPIAWQGWAVLGVWGAACWLAARRLHGLPLVAVLLAISLVLRRIASAHTPGGWRWRSDGRDGAEG